MLDYQNSPLNLIASSNRLKDNLKRVGKFFVASFDSDNSTSIDRNFYSK